MTTNAGHGQDRKRRITSMLDEADIAELEAIAHGQRVSLAWVIRDAVKSYLAQRAPLLHPELLRQQDRSGV